MQSKQLIHAQINVRVNFGEISNLTYQLDCVSGLLSNCSKANFHELWNREFLKTLRDREMLEEWQYVRSRYTHSVELQRTTEYPLAMTSDIINLFDKVRITGFQAVDLNYYAMRLDLLTTPADRATLERVVRHFHPSFVLWWRRKAQVRGVKFRRDTEALLRSPKVARQLQQFYHFYAPALPPGYEVRFILLYRPNLVRESTNGEQLENYSLSEFLPEERPKSRLPVVIHELCHYFYRSALPASIVKLQQRFLDARRTTAIPAYNLLNEAIATAFGNGMVARSFMPKERWEKYKTAKLSFYNNESVDRAAKAILPWLDAWLASGKTLHDQK